MLYKLPHLAKESHKICYTDDNQCVVITIIDHDFFQQILLLWGNACPERPAQGHSVHTNFWPGIANLLPALLDAGALAQSQDGQIRKALQQEILHIVVFLFPHSVGLGFLFCWCGMVLGYWSWLEALKVFPVVTGNHGHLEADQEDGPIGAILFKARDVSEGWVASVLRVG